MRTQHEAGARLSAALALSMAVAVGWIPAASGAQDPYEDEESTEEGATESPERGQAEEAAPAPYVLAPLAPLASPGPGPGAALQRGSCCGASMSKSPLSGWSPELKLGTSGPAGGGESRPGGASPFGAGVGGPGGFEVGPLPGYNHAPWSPSIGIGPGAYGNIGGH